MKLIGLIAATLALRTLRWHSRPRDEGGKHRVVVMDDFIYGQPQPVH